MSDGPATSIGHRRHPKKPCKRTTHTGHANDQLGSRRASLPWLVAQKVPRMLLEYTIKFTTAHSEARRRRKEGGGEDCNRCGARSQNVASRLLRFLPLRGTAEKCVRVCVTGPAEEDSRKSLNSSIWGLSLHLQMNPFLFDTTRHRS